MSTEHGKAASTSSRRNRELGRALVASLVGLMLALSGCSPVAEVMGAPELEKLPIVGGSEVSIDQWPWQVSVQTRSGSHFCGGLILTEEWILTAQHCVDGDTASQMRVEAGITNLSDYGQTSYVSEIVTYPGYRSPEYGKDVALLRLSSPLTFGRGVQPILLATESDASLFAAGTMAYVSGWGTLTEGGSIPDTLNALAVPVVSYATAESAYGSLTSDQIGAGYMGTGGRDSCQGDSGGPLVVADATGGDYVLAGVVSWGSGCADAYYPGMYARVASFVSWIESYTGDLSDADAEDPVTVVGDVALADGDTASLSAPAGSFVDTIYRVDVPADATSLTVTMEQLSGDPDLYVKQGSVPTTLASSSASDSDADCVPYYGPTRGDEVCTFAIPDLAAGTSYYIRVAGYGAASSARLSVSVETAAATTPEETTPEETTPSTSGSPTDADGMIIPGNVTVSPLGASSGEMLRFRVEVSASTADDFAFELVGPNGDADLYVTRDDGWPDQVGYHCSSRGSDSIEACTTSDSASLSGAGTYYVLVHAYSTFSDAELTVTYSE